MLARQASAVIQARCPNCGSRYSGSGPRFLYSDEDGIRCPECGSILVEEAGPADGGSYAYCRTIPEHLENSDLHRQLKKPARGYGAEVLVDPTNSSRTFGRSADASLRCSAYPPEDAPASGANPDREDTQARRSRSPTGMAEVNTKLLSGPVRNPAPRDADRGGERGRRVVLA